MRCRMTAEGVLEIEPQGGAEAVALGLWFENFTGDEIGHRWAVLKVSGAMLKYGSGQLVDFPPYQIATKAEPVEPDIEPQGDA